MASPMDTDDLFSFLLVVRGGYPGRCKWLQLPAVLELAGGIGGFESRELKFLQMAEMRLTKMKEESI